MCKFAQVTWKETKYLKFVSLHKNAGFKVMVMTLHVSVFSERTTR